MEEGKGILHQVYTSREADELYGLGKNTVNKWCNRGKFTSEESRKSGSTWLVTKAGMQRVMSQKGTFPRIVNK